MKAFEKYIWASISVSSSQLKKATQTATCMTPGAGHSATEAMHAHPQSLHPGKLSPP